MIGFTSINLDKEGAQVKLPSDVKNEVWIITLVDETYKLWEKFIFKHTEGSLIDLVMHKPFNEAKNFNLKNTSLKREFFKHLGHFADKDLKEFVLHLLGRTERRTWVYPKVLVSATWILCEDNYKAEHLVERRKRKKIVMDEFMGIDKSLKFKDAYWDVKDEIWRK